ncbi:MAG: carboxypeptidase regulatory-like domain-containing protein, partial [Methylobacterium sp.]
MTLALAGLALLGLPQAPQEPMFGMGIAAGPGRVSVGWPKPEKGRWVFDFTFEKAGAFQWEGALAEIRFGDVWRTATIVDEPSRLPVIGQLPRDGELRFIAFPREESGPWPDAVRVTLKPADGGAPASLVFAGLPEEPVHPARERRVQIRIVDESGQPVPGARAALPASLRGHNAFLGWRPSARGLNSTGELPVRDGVAEAIVRDWKGSPGPFVVAGAPGYGLGGVQVTKEGETFTIRLPKPVAISGRLLYPDGRPAAGKAVVAHLDSLPTEDGLFTLKAVTDADGRYRIEGLPQGARVRIASPRNGLLKAQPFSDWSSETVLLPRQAAFERPDIRLSAPARLEGRVTKGGQGVAGAPVSAIAKDRQRRFMTATDAEGRYAFDGLVPSEYRVLAEPPESWSDAFAAHALKGIAVKPGEARRGADLAFHAFGTVEGTLLTRAGRPFLADLAVEGEDDYPVSDEFEGSLQNRNDGTFRIPLFPGRYKVFVKEDGRTIATARVTVKDGLPTQL